jgi:hypothetical protein
MGMPFGTVPDHPHRDEKILSSFADMDSPAATYTPRNEPGRANRSLYCRQ